MRSRYGAALVGLLAVALASPSLAVLAPQGGELVVNRTPDSQQENPSAVFGPGGVSLVVWADTKHGVRGQLFAAGGAKLGGALELAPNQAPPVPGEGNARLALEPTAVFFPNGSFLVAWAEESGFMRVAPFHQTFDVEARRVLARRFNSNGKAAGPVFAISAATDRLESWPKLHALPDGRALAIWRSDRDGGGTAGNGLFARHLTRLGRPTGAELRVSADLDRDANFAAIAESPGGEILVAWEGCCDAGGDLGIFARAYDAASGTFGTQRQVNVETTQRQRRPALAADGDHGFLVLWQGIIDRSTGRIFGRFVDLTGETTGAQFQVSHGFSTVQLAPAVAPRPGGGFLAAWRDYVGVYFGVTAVELGAAGNPLGEPVRLHDRSVQKNGRTSLATDGAGTFLIPWEKGFRGRPAIGGRRLRSE
jgi:hypothetical protein